VVESYKIVFVFSGYFRFTCSDRHFCNFVLPKGFQIHDTTTDYDDDITGNDVEDGYKVESMSD